MNTLPGKRERERESEIARHQMAIQAADWI